TYSLWIAQIKHLINSLIFLETNRLTAARLDFPSIMSSNDDSDFKQVEDEPAPTTKSGAVGTRATRTKIYLKLITIKPFDGSTKDGFIGPGAYDWSERLKTWQRHSRSESGRKRYSAVFLPPDSRVKLVPGTTATALTFRRTLSVTSRTNSWRSSGIAAGLNRGKVDSYTKQQAVSTFINHAYPRFQVDLEAKLDQEAEDATGELKSAVVLLTQLAKSDGKINPNKRRSEYFSRDSSDKKPQISGSASATTAKAPRPRWDFSDALCKTCNAHDKLPRSSCRPASP
ncbi:hypothetical protein GN958_ATG19504, partial [Phytophthora infestans]